MKNRDFRELVDQNLSGLVWDERRRRNVLLAIDKEEKPVKKFSVSVVVITLILCISVPALAAGLLVAGRVDAMQLADEALCEKYGITDAMHTYFSKSVQENADGSVVVTYAGFADFAYVLGTYTATVENGQAEVIWSRDGEPLDGGFDSPAWGAPQLEEALLINQETHSFGEVYTKAVEHAQAAGVAKYETPEFQVNLPPDGYQSWEHYYRTQALPVMAIAPKDALLLAKDAIVQRYNLTQAQADAMQWHDTWTDFSMVGDVPVLDVWYSLTLQEGTWSDGDGLYGASVNVETGVIEEVMYDSALAGNG